MTGTGASAARLLPPMLGADGPRDYLVVFQNLAEPRATGGMFGSFAVVHTDQGKVTVLDEGTPTRTLGRVRSTRRAAVGRAAPNCTRPDRPSIRPMST